MQEQREAEVGAAVLLIVLRRRLALGLVKIVYFFLPGVVVIRILADSVAEKNGLLVLMVELGLPAVGLREETVKEQKRGREPVVFALVRECHRLWG